jgi:hypothetical protein
MLPPEQAPAFRRGEHVTMQAPSHIGAPPIVAFMSQALAALVHAAPGSIWEDMDAWPDPSWHQAYGSGMEAGSSSHKLGSAEEDQPAALASELAPISPTQARLASIWCNVLGVAHVDQKDDFLRLAGTPSPHSAL